MVGRLLIACWSALLPVVERERLRQRLSYEVPTVPASWALALAQVGLIPVWAIQGIVYLSSVERIEAAAALDSGAAVTDLQLASVVLGPFAYIFSPLGLLLEYAIITGAFRLAGVVASGRPVGDPLVSGFAWLMRAARSEQIERQRLRELGPERPDRIIEHEGEGLLVLCSREKAEWDERVTIQFGERFYRLAHREEQPYGKWTAIAYVLRPTQPGEVIRGLVRLEGRVQPSPSRRSEQENP